MKLTAHYTLEIGGLSVEIHRAEVVAENMATHPARHVSDLQAQLRPAPIAKALTAALEQPREEPEPLGETNIP